MFNGFLAFLLFIASGFIILLVLVQRGKGGGLTGALGGMGGQSAFGAKAGDVFTKITVASAAIWIVLCLITIRAFSYIPVNKDNIGAYDGEGLFKADGQNTVVGGNDPVGLPSIGGTGDETDENEAGKSEPDDESKADEKAEVEDSKSSEPPVPPTNPDEKSEAEKQDPKPADSGKSEADGQPEKASQPGKAAEPAKSGENEKTSEPEKSGEAEKSGEPKKSVDGN